MNRCAVGLCVALLASRIAAADCRPPPLGHVPFTIGEKIEYNLELLGARLGSLVLDVHPSHAPDAYSITARAQTDSMAGDFYNVDAIAESHLSRTLQPHSFEDSGVEQGVNISSMFTLPPKVGQINVTATREGSPANYSLEASTDAVDLITLLYQLRAATPAPDATFCYPVIAGRHLYLLTGKNAGRDMIRTPGGDYESIHLAGNIVRADGTPSPAREIHLWVSDDAQRIPVMAIGVMAGKPLSIRMQRYTPGIRRRR